MRIEEEIKKQLDHDNLPSNGKDEKLYQLLFTSLSKKQKSLLSDDFENRVLSRIRYPLFTWREIAVFTLLALMPVIGLSYFGDFAAEVLRLPIISWIADHAVAIAFGIVLLLGIQLSDRLFFRHLSH